MAKKGQNQLGAWAFLIGVLLAIIFAFVEGGTTVAWILLVVGIVVGLLNIGAKEVTTFLMAGAVLVIVSSLGAPYLGMEYISDVLANLSAIFVPATIVVALKSVFAMARN